MKRFFILILSVALCLMFTLSGCTSESVLEFSSTLVKDIKKETLTYSVSLEKEYRDIKIGSAVNENILPKYENGIYITEYQTEILPSDYTGDLGLTTSQSIVNRITTNFTIDVVDTKGTADASDDKVYKDQILTEVYFFGSDLSYAPILSKTIVKNTYVAQDQTQIEYAHKIYQYTTTYKKDSFVVTKKYYDQEENEDITGVMDLNALDENKLVSIKGNGRAYEYSFRQVLDNTQLIFATRNTSLPKGSSIYVPTVSYMYSDPSTLQITNSTNATLNVSTALNYRYTKNGSATTKSYAESSLSVPVKNMNIKLSGTDYMGLPKYLSVQSGTADDGNILNNGLVFEYAEALISASYNCLGALVFRLNDVNITFNA